MALDHRGTRGHAHRGGKVQTDGDGNSKPEATVGEGQQWSELTGLPWKGIWKLELAHWGPQLQEECVILKSTRVTREAGVV